MPSRDDDNTSILIQIAGDIGETREGITNLKENYNSLAEDIRDIKEKLVRTVRQDECTQRHFAVANGLNSLKQEIVAEFKKSSTGKGYPAITSQMIEEENKRKDKEIQEKEEFLREKRRKEIQFWAWVASIAFAVLTSVALGTWKFFIWMNDVKHAVSITKNETIRSYKLAEKAFHVEKNKYRDMGVNDYK